MDPGTTVLVNFKHKGVVRHYGPVHFDQGDMVGVELERPVGDNDGSVHGVRYFSCQAKKGIFVPPNQVEVFSEQTKAASAVQAVSRKLLAQRKALKERNSKVWNKLDNLNEQLAIRRSMQLQTLFGSEDQVTTSDGASLDIQIEDDYEGPHLDFNKLTLDQVLDMLEHFKQGRILHIKYGFEILSRTKKMLAAEPTLQEIAIAEGKKLTVVGDIHGQLQDLFSIFTINGLPGPDNEYLFNGDFVDRGHYGAECCWSLFCFKLLFPNAVRLNRGNHESRQQNRLMGFEEEILGKYPGPYGRILLQQFHGVMDQVPLCALIQEKIFVVHGGLFPHDGVTLDHIRGMSRKREPPIHSPAFEDQLFEAMLWSDPRPIQGRQLSTRGAGVEFGQDVTHEFLRTNHMALVIRSHECVREGFELLHAGRLITLFSASRYCGLQTNKGAFLTIGSELQPEIQQFYAHSVSETHWEKPSSENASDGENELEQRLEDNTIELIIERIVDAKPSLYWHFTRQDKDRTGTVTRMEWAQGLKLVLQLDLPFLSYQDRLAEVEDDGSINYGKFLERYRVEMAGVSADWADGVVDSICEKMFKALGAGNVEEAFNMFDTDKSGTIEYEEFIAMLKQLDIGLSDQQIFELMRGLDKDNDSVIDPKEFASRFELVFEKMGGDGAGAAPESGGVTKDIPTVAAAIFKNLGTPKVAFGVLDPDGAGKISMDRFVSEVHALGVPFSEDHLRQLGAAIDADGDGLVSLQEFCRAFRVVDQRASKSRQSISNMVAARKAAAQAQAEIDPSAAGEPGDGGWQEGVIQQISNFMFQHRSQLASAFRAFDLDNSGSISAEEFVTGMSKMNALFNKPLTRDQIIEIMRSLDEDGDGTLSYKEFLDGFRVVDTNNPGRNQRPSSGTA
mmetsp:Transcript_35609/g.61601  ORF Transcript_35609/g.61601 Transcript_35609/m.61601 type:complete len:900 (+) Transcript_35609:141-2840(+)